MSPTRSAATVDESITDDFATLWEFVPRIAGRMFATLLLSGREHSSRELMERLGVSSASISTMGRHLVTLGLVERRVSPETRRDLFRVPDDAWTRARERDLRFWGRMKAWLDGALTYARRRPDGVVSPALVQMRDYFAFLEADYPNQVARYAAWRAERDLAERDTAGA